MTPLFEVTEVSSWLSSYVDIRVNVSSASKLELEDSEDEGLRMPYSEWLSSGPVSSSVWYNVCFLWPAKFTRFPFCGGDLQLQAKCPRFPQLKHSTAMRSILFSSCGSIISRSSSESESFDLVVVAGVLVSEEGLGGFILPNLSRGLAFRWSRL